MPSRLEAIKAQRAQEALMLNIERAFTVEVKRAKRKYIKDVLDLFKKTGLIRSDRLFDDHVKQMEAIYTKHTGRAIKAFSAYHSDALKAGGRVFDTKKVAKTTWELWQKLWLERVALKRAKLTSETTRNDLQTALLKAKEEQEGPDQIIKRLNALNTINQVRAVVIARTETHAAAMFATAETFSLIQSETGTPLLKYWAATEDERTREAHAAMDSEAGIPLDDLFDVGGEEMDRPGDPNASPENTINCRCVLVSGEL